MEPVTCLEKPLKLRWNSKSFSQRRIIHIVMHTPSKWTVHTECFKRILDNYKELMTLWKFCLENDNMAIEVKSRIVGVKKQMEERNFFFVLNVGHRVYSHTDNLWKTLQAEKMSACTSKRTTELVVYICSRRFEKRGFVQVFIPDYH